ncbi:phage portal protein [Kitasatospora sp. RB6PN24]|uniref:phage portal protein n=1 Tax=Kitasatospora humi TaxID=2893891 RepID=UPI001E540B4A|nr:phage portal protein [Kitasatospora humi]MCC9307694.1 phage portal protein [Kitasatospora humi]
MGAVSWLREAFRRAPAVPDPAVVEAASPDAPTAAQVRRVGYEYGIPLNAVTSSAQVAATSERQQVLSQLHQAYMSCIWVSSPIDLIARTVTAGGIQLVPDAGPDGQAPEDPPPVARLRRLLRFVNPHEDMVQLLRNVATDLLLFGDAYLEIVWLLGEPVALYTLDATTMTVLSDQHGEVTGYRQDVDGVRTATFKPRDVIHISLDAPRGGLYGVSPAQKALLPVVAWLFWEATLKECGRRGDPPRLHVDLAHFQDTDVQRWREQYRVYNLGPKAVGEPVVTTGGGAVGVLDGRKVTDYLDATRQLRDEIISCFGTPPAKLGIIESGNLGGGTGEQQDKTFRVNTVIPIANLLLEKLNYHLLQVGFGITDWHLEFGEIDYRDSKVVEEIRETRLRNGAYTLNRWRAEIGEPPVEGGDDAIFMERTFIADWANMGDLAKSFIIKNLGGNSVPAPSDPTDLAPPASGDGPSDPEDGPGLANDAKQGTGPRESASETAGPTAAERVYDQLLANYPASTLGWVLGASWSGPTDVPLDQVSFDHEEQWAASHEPKRVKHFLKQIRRKGRTKPVVLLRTPSSQKLIIVDGHHRSLAYRQAGKPIRAWIGTVAQNHGPWDELHSSQHHGTSNDQQEAWDALYQQCLDEALARIG